MRIKLKSICCLCLLPIRALCVPRTVRVRVNYWMATNLYLNYLREIVLFVPTLRFLSVSVPFQFGPQLRKNYDDMLRKFSKLTKYREHQTLEPDRLVSCGLWKRFRESRQYLRCIPIHIQGWFIETNCRHFVLWSWNPSVHDSLSWLASEQAISSPFRAFRAPPLPLSSINFDTDSTKWTFPKMDILPRGGKGEWMNENVI